MSTIVRGPLAPRVDLGLLILRLVIGGVFIAHGAQKIFQVGLGNVGGMFGQMGVPMPGVAGPLVALVELLGGLALVFGLLTRLASLGLAIDMLGAILLVHLKNGFFMQNSGYEYALTLLGASLALMFTGAGAYSLDAMIAGRRAGGTRNS
jgi:putative oxidoreductase